MGRELPSFELGEYALDFDASDITNQYTCVVLAGAKNGAKGTGMGNAAMVRPKAGAPILGVLQSNGRINESVKVMEAGETMARVSASSAGGDVWTPMATDANGAFIEAKPGDFAIGMAVEKYQAGDITTVLLGKYGKQ